MTDSLEENPPKQMDEDSPDSPVRKRDESPTEAHGGEGAEDAGPSGQEQVDETKLQEHDD